MGRRKFIQKSTVFAACFFIAENMFAKNDASVYWLDTCGTGWKRFTLTNLHAFNFKNYC